MSTYQKKNIIFLLILINIHFIFLYDFLPNDYKEADYFFPSEDTNSETYHLVAAKLISKEDIPLQYVVQQGIYLDIDSSCNGNFVKTNKWDDMKAISNLKNLYENSVYSIDSIDGIECDLPIPNFKNPLYEYHHYAYLMKPDTEIQARVSISNNIVCSSISLVTKIDIKIIYRNSKYIVTCNGSTDEIELTYISKIKYHSTSNISPAISFHWTILTISINAGGFSLIGSGQCDNLNNPCVSGYTCIGGECKKCHESCFDCTAEGLSSGCLSKCSSHSQSPLPDSSSSSCQFGFVDVSQFLDFTLPKVLPPVNGRVSFGFWMFFNIFSDISRTISSSLLTIEIKITEGRNFEVYCADMIYIFGDDESEILNTWIYIKCGVSSDHKLKILYVRGRTKDLTYQQEGHYSSILYYNTGFDHTCNHPFKKYFHDNEYFDVYFKGEKKPNKYFKLYFREFVIFRDLAWQPFDIRHYEIEKIISNSDEVPEILYVVPFDSLIRDGGKYKTKTYSFYGTKEEYILELSPNNTLNDGINYFNLYSLHKFKRLPLISEPNKMFSSPDFTTTTAIEKGEYDYLVIDKNTPISCVTKHFLTINTQYILNGPYDTKCDQNCDDHYMFPGLSKDKGQCNRKCDTSNDHIPSVCFTNNDMLIDIMNNFRCIEGYYKTNYICEKEEKEDLNAFFFSSSYTPNNIIFDVSSYELNSYFIDFWLWPYISSSESYLFYTNTIRFENSLNGKYTIYFNNLNFKINKPINIYEWNHIVFHVYYDPLEDWDKKTKVYFMINGNYEMNDGNLIEEFTNENPFPLRKIYFCHKYPATCDGIDINWSSGFYKYLRVFNGEKTSPNILYLYDQFFKGAPNPAIVISYPLTGQYIADNILKQESKTTSMNTRVNSNSWNFPQYNYCNNDIMGDEGKYYDNNHVTHNCPSDCYRCFNDAKCYKCNEGFVLNAEGKCDNDNDSNHVMKLPSNLNFLICLNGIPKTIIFKIRIFGFTSEKRVDVIYFSDNLKLVFVGDEKDPNPGLNLVSFGGAYENVLANHRHFRNYIGKWVYISLSGYDSIPNKGFFPSMLRWEINDEQVPMINTLPNFQINKIWFGKELYALVKDISVYDDYIVNVPKYLTSTSTPTPTTYLRPKGKNDCKLKFKNDEKCIETESGDKPYDCVLDKKDPITNSNKDKCSYNNGDKKFLLGSMAEHNCKDFTYINYAKAKLVSNSGTNLINVQSAGMNGEFTMHFWVYVYPYTEDGFGGLKWEWTGHNTISIVKKSFGEYVFKCSIQYKEGFLPFKLKTWNFLHCAVDYNVNKLYMRTTTEKIDISFDYSTRPTELGSSSTTFTYQDLTTNMDWGVVYFMYIRLWKEALKYPDFLSRVNINTASKFSSLIIQWNPLYVSNKKVVPKGNGGPLEYYTVSYEPKIGSNIINEEPEELTFCNEDGVYYDRKNDKCVPFFDISNLNGDLVFEKIDVAYSHSYTIGFWIMLEDPESVINPIIIDWSLHMQIALIFSEAKKMTQVFCFPENFPPYDEIISNQDSSLESKSSDVLNSLENEYSELDGKWTWIQCALSYQMRYMYLNENYATMKTETLFVEKETDASEGSKVKNNEPLGFFFNDLTESLSTLTVKVRQTDNAITHKKVYMRSLYLFKDYLPYNYNYKYMNFFEIEGNIFPPLTFAIDFANFKIEGSYKLTYATYSSKDSSKTEGILNRNLKYSSHLELSANFVYMPLCQMKLKKEKYNEETRLCEEINDCEIISLNCLYCMGERTPVICKKNYYINIDPRDGSVTCSNSCGDNYFRTPGTEVSTGICGTECPDSGVLKTCPNIGNSLLNYQTSFACKESYPRIGYQCYDPSISQNEGALYYSGCNYPYNIYHIFSDTFKSSVGNGYILELWMMLDNVICKQDDESTTKYTYFYTNIHHIYKEKGVFKFKVANKDIEPDGEIHRFEWNKILIHTDTNNKNVKVTINFKKTEKVPTSVGSAILTLNSIHFCSKNGNNNNPKKPSCGTTNNLVWGSAYYNNIRIWNILTASTEVIQAYITGMYNEIPKSLLLYYPLNIKNLDNNQMNNLMTNKYPDDHIKLDVGNDCGMYNTDNIIIYNWSSKFDWGLTHPHMFVSAMDDERGINSGSPDNKCHEKCIRCYNKDTLYECYECEPGFVLKYQECVDSNQKYYLKVPSPSIVTSISFKTTNEDNKNFCDLTSFTLIFFIKFFGVIDSSPNENVLILGLNSNTYLAYSVSKNDLIFLQNAKIAFEDKNFMDYRGFWIPIAIADYISKEINDIYPNMLTLSVNRIDIPFEPEYSIPASGIKPDQLIIGNEIIALFAHLRIYNKFIQGVWGKIYSETEEVNLFYHKELVKDNPNSCLTSDDLVSPVEVVCVADFTPLFETDHLCKDDKKYFHFPFNSNEKTPSCEECDNKCETYCYYGSEFECTCDMTEGKYWLRVMTEQPKRTYCEHIYYTDFSNLKPYTFLNAPISDTYEFTMEFWLYVHSYNNNPNNFKSISIEWNYHNKMLIKNDGGSLKVTCYPIFNPTNTNIETYPDSWTTTLTFDSWNYVRCGTNFLTKKYFLIGTEYTLLTKEENFFDYKTIKKNVNENLKMFKIYRSSDSNPNFGFIFITEIKLWQQYNLRFIDSQYIKIDDKDNEYANFPGLLAYFRNEYNLDENGNILITEEITNNIQGLTRDINYVGYNIVDREGTRPPSLREVCDFTYVYNGITRECDKLEPLSNSGCEVYSSSHKNCLLCKGNKQFLNPDDGECYADCPPRYFNNRLINQCRNCHETCYTCEDRFYNNCTSCTGELYLNAGAHTCIPVCEAVQLTKSLSRPNLCVVFEAEASLVNVDVLSPININTFDYIQAEIIGATSTGYITEWWFDVNKTNAINRELGFTDYKSDMDIPFTSDITRLKVDLKSGFFSTSHKYVFGLNIIKENKGEKIIIPVEWILTMNSPPYNGRVVTMPDIGFYNTTTFVIRCEDYEDENTLQNELEYKFYYVEYNTNSKIYLTNTWSLFPETFSNFTVRYYQEEYTYIDIYCICKDKYGAESETSSRITLVNKVSSDKYNLEKILEKYTLDTDLNDIQLLARSECLKSLGINFYTDKIPSTLYSLYSSSITGERVEMADPLCISGFCNDRGTCEVIDIVATCDCETKFSGMNCQIDKTHYTGLASEYKKMFNRLIKLVYGIVPVPLNDYYFWSFYHLYFAAQHFFEDDTFFTHNLIELKSYLQLENTFILTNTSTVDKYMDFNDFYFHYFYIKLNQLKLESKINAGYPFRNQTIESSNVYTYQTAFKNLIELFHDDAKYLIKNYRQNYHISTTHFNFYLQKINADFNDKEFFLSLGTVEDSYKPIVEFMQCLREKKLTFNYFLYYIEFLQNPFSYDIIYFANMTSPFIILEIFDYNGNQISLSECEGNKIKVSLPFKNYDYLIYINKQKHLFDPDNYKLENDPIFKDPIYIFPNGTVSDDKVSDRIDKYYRYNNLSGLVYTPTETNIFDASKLTFLNISDNFLIEFETDALYNGFTTYIIPNEMIFVVDGRFYYLKKPQLLICKDNYFKNPCFIIMLVFFLYFLITSIIWNFYDYPYYTQLEQLEFLQKEIIKAHFPYKQVNEGLNDENIIKMIPRKNPNADANRRWEIRHMFDNINFEDIEEVDEDESQFSEKVYDINVRRKSNSNSNNSKGSNRNSNSKGSNNNSNSKESNSNSNINSNNKQESETYKLKLRNNVNEENNDKLTEEIKSESGYGSDMKSNHDLYLRSSVEKLSSNPPPRTNFFEDSDNSSNFGNKNKKKKRSKLETGGLEDIISNPSEVYSIKGNKKKQTKSESSYGEMHGYGEEYDQDFDGNSIASKSRLESIASKSRKNSNASSINSSLQSFSKTSRLSRKKYKNNNNNYFQDRDKTRPNLVSIKKFHDPKKAVFHGHLPIDYVNEEQEREKELDAYTKLLMDYKQFFRWNIDHRHILTAPFKVCSMFTPRWKKLIILLTQIYLNMAFISVFLTLNEKIILSNIIGCLYVSLVICFFSDAICYFLILFYKTSTYQRKRLYRLVMSGEDLMVIKAFKKLEHTTNCWTIFGLIFTSIFWLINLYITVTFTSVWKEQRGAWILCVFLSLLFDLTLFEYGIEGINAFLYNQRKKNDRLRNMGEWLNRVRAFRAIYP